MASMDINSVPRCRRLGRLRYVRLLAQGILEWPRYLILSTIVQLAESGRRFAVHECRCTAPERRIVVKRVIQVILPVEACLFATISTVEPACHIIIGAVAVSIPDRFDVASILENIVIQGKLPVSVFGKSGDGSGVHARPNGLWR